MVAPGEEQFTPWRNVEERETQATISRRPEKERGHPGIKNAWINREDAGFTARKRSSLTVEETHEKKSTATCLGYRERHQKLAVSDLAGAPANDSGNDR